MTIADSFKKQINNAFLHIIFPKRNVNCIKGALSTKVYGSDVVTILPPIQGIEVEVIDDTHDKVTFSYDDYAFSGLVTWKETKNGFIFLSYE